MKRRASLIVALAVCAGFAGTKGEAARLGTTSVAVNASVADATLGAPWGLALDGVGGLFIADPDHNQVLRLDLQTGALAIAAGNGTADFSGDGGPATEASLNKPYAVAVDASGNLFIKDNDNQRIRKVDAETGIITTIAGTGAAEFGGDGGPATEASFQFFETQGGVAFDASGNLYVSEAYRARKIDAETGIITTVAGNGMQGFGGDGGPATGAEIGSRNLAIDTAGNLLIADAFHNRIRLVDMTTGIIETIVGKGGPGRRGDYPGRFKGDGKLATKARLNFPGCVVVDAAGDLIIADTTNQRIRKVDAQTNRIRTIAGNGNRDFSGDGGPALGASFRYPQSLAVDAAGNLYIADTNNGRVRKVDAATAIITTIAGGSQ